jgi:hypothetical protein
MSKVINRKNIVISHNLVPFETWNQTIGLDFQADQMIVKSIVYAGAADPTVKQVSVMFIKSSLVNNQIMGSIYDGCAYNPDLVYQLPSWTDNNTWTFRIENSTGVLDTTFNGVLCMHLEFTQHEKK